MAAHMREELRAAHEARFQGLQLEAEAKLKLIQAEADCRHEEAMVARIAHAEAKHSHVVESLRGDLAAKDATNADILARSADLDGRHRAMGANAVQYAHSEAAFQKACTNVSDAIDKLKTNGARELAVRRHDAEETIARLQSAPDTSILRLAITQLPGIARAAPGCFVDRVMHVLIRREAFRLPALRLGILGFHIFNQDQQVPGCVRRGCKRSGLIHIISPAHALVPQRRLAPRRPSDGDQDTKRQGLPTSLPAEPSSVRSLFWAGFVATVVPIDFPRFPSSGFPSSRRRLGLSFGRSRSDRRPYLALRLLDCFGFGLGCLSPARMLVPFGIPPRFPGVPASRLHGGPATS